MAFRRGLDRDALLEQLDGLLDLALAQTFGSQLPQFARSFVVCHSRGHARPARDRNSPSRSPDHEYCNKDEDDTQSYQEQGSGLIVSHAGEEVPVDRTSTNHVRRSYLPGPMEAPAQQYASRISPFILAAPSLVAIRRDANNYYHYFRN